MFETCADRRHAKKPTTSSSLEVKRPAASSNFRLGNVIAERLRRHRHGVRNPAGFAHVTMSLGKQCF